MKLSRTLALAGLGATTLSALLLAQGCSSSSSSTTPTSDAGSGSGSGSSGKDAATDAPAKTDGSSTGSGSGSSDNYPTLPTGAAKTTVTTPHNFAIHNLYLGDTKPTPAFTTDTNAWGTFGYNIDGKITTAKSTDVCSPFTHGSVNQQVDGPGGVDNAFGNVIVNNVLTLANVTSSSLEGNITKGSFTLMFDTVGLDGTATQTASGLSGQLFAGSTYSGTPAVTGTSWSLSDNWPVNGSLLNDPTNVASGSKVSFNSAFVTKGLWVSGTPATIALALSLSGKSLSINIHSAIVTMPVSKDASGQFHTTGGIISGVIQTSELVTAIDQLAGNLGYCQLVSSILPAIEGASDIVIDPTSGAVSNTMGTPCNGISIGLEFDADEIAQPSTIAPASDGGAGGLPCGADAGAPVDSGTDSSTTDAAATDATAG